MNGRYETCKKARLGFSSQAQIIFEMRVRDIHTPRHSDVINKTNKSGFIVGLHQPRPPDKILYKFNEKNCECLQ